MTRHTLKDLARKHIAAEVDTEQALAGELRRLKLPSKAAGGFAVIPLNNEVFVTLAWTKSSPSASTRCCDPG